MVMRCWCCGSLNAQDKICWKCGVNLKISQTRLDDFTLNTRERVKLWDVRRTIARMRGGM